MVEVFKTNIRRKRAAKEIAGDLARVFPHAKINFDLDDCDKILRVESLSLCVDHVIQVLEAKGFTCEVLE